MKPYKTGLVSKMMYNLLHSLRFYVTGP